MCCATSGGMQARENCREHARPGEGRGEALGSRAPFAESSGSAQWASEASKIECVVSAAVQVRAQHASSRSAVPIATRRRRRRRYAVRVMEFGVEEETQTSVLATPLVHSESAEGDEVICREWKGNPNRDAAGKGYSTEGNEVNSAARVVRRSGKSGTITGTGEKETAV